MVRERGSPAVIGIPSFRPVALRPRLSTGLPLSLNAKCQIVADRRQGGIVCRGSQVVSRIGDTVICSRLCSARRCPCVPETSGTRQVPCIETVVEVAVGDCEPGARRVNEATVSRIDADVIYAMSADPEEHQIARRELRKCHRMRGALLLRRGAGNDEPDALVHVQHQATAIEAGAVRTAEVVRRADERDREPRNRISRSGARRGRLWRWCAGTTAEGDGRREYDRGERRAQFLRVVQPGSPRNCASYRAVLAHCPG